MSTTNNKNQNDKIVLDSKPKHEIVAQLQQIPNEFKQIDAWVLYDFDSKKPKLPLKEDGSPASWKEDSDLLSFDDALSAIMTNEKFDGIGLNFSKADGYYFIDWDNCFTESNNAESRKNWCPNIERISEETCTEYSSSGTGAHTFIKGKIPDWWEDADGDDEHEGIELYDSRLCIFTGDVIGTGSVISCEDFPVEFDQILLKSYTSLEGEEPQSLQEDSNEKESTNGRASDDVIDAIHNIDPHVISDVLWSDCNNKEKIWEEWDPDYRNSKSGTSLVRNKDSSIWYDFKLESKGFDTLKLFAAERGRIKNPTEDLTGEDWVKTYKNFKGKVNIDLPELEDQKLELEEDSDWYDIRGGFAQASNQSERGECQMVSAERLVNDSGWLTTMDTNELYYYENGIYKENGEQILRKELTQKLREQYTKRRATTIEDMLRGQTLVNRDDIGADEGLVVVENGVLDVVDRKLIDYDSDITALNKMPVKYDEDASEPTNFLNYLEDVVEDEKERMKLQEFVGYTLMHWDIQFEKALFIVGPTNSGKSTFIDIVNMLHDDNAVAHVTPQEILELRFKSAQLFGSWLNTRNDIPSETVKNVGKFKELISGEEMVMEKKNQPNFSYGPDAKHIFAGNQLPSSSVDDSAFYERVLLCAMPKTIPRKDQDRDLLRKVEQELSGVLNWALDGLDRLLEQNGFTADKTASETEIMWNKWSSSVKRFGHECIKKTGNKDDDLIAKATVMKMFQVYTEKRGMPSASKKIVTETISADALVSHTPTGGSDGTGVFTGIQFTPLGEELYKYVMDEKDGNEDRIDELLAQ